MSNFKTVAASVAVLSAMSVPVFAGSYAEPVVEPAPMAPAPVVDYGSDWSGFYGGVQLGYGDVSGESGLDGIDGDGGIYGLHAGYNYDFGTWVVGAEADYDKMDIDLGDGAATVDDVARLKMKVGYDLGRTLLYATAGAARVNTSVGNDTGPFYGVGMSYMISENFLLGAELLRHDFSDLGGTDGFDASANTVTVRASYKF